MSTVTEPYLAEDVEFDSRGTVVRGRLYLPTGTEGPFPAVTVLGPVASVKEQSPQQYATRLARLGFAALVFDPRHHGASDGEPRRLESGQLKVDDVRASVDYLASRPEIDSAHIDALGVCQGVNWTVGAALEDERVRRVAIVAGHYLTRRTSEMYTGGADALEARLAASDAALEIYRTTGEVEYIPIVSAEDPNSLLTAEPIRQWYTRWADRGPAWTFHGQWENRIPRMSERGIWGHDVKPVLEKLTKPTLMIHSDGAASGPVIPKDMFEGIGAEDKKLIWLGNQVQFQFYEEPETIDRASAHVAAWFNEA